MENGMAFANLSPYQLPSDKDEDTAPTGILTDIDKASKAQSTAATDIQSAFAAMNTKSVDDRLDDFEDRILKMMQQILRKQSDGNEGSSRNIRTNRAGHSQEYCWTHGLCNHSSPKCRNKKE